MQQCRASLPLVCLLVAACSGGADAPDAREPTFPGIPDAPIAAHTPDAAVPDASLDAPQRSCPAPTVVEGEDCILTGDAQLDATMIIPSFTRVDCRGHRLTPSQAGVLDEPRTAGNEFQASVPDLAMFVHRAEGVTIVNCVIEGFDFGVVVARARGGARHEIRGNTITSRTNAIFLTQAANVLIRGNQLTYESERGRGIVVEHDSDDNHIVGNIVTSTDAASTGLVRGVPGGAYVTESPAARLDDEIHVLMGDAVLRNFVVNGVLIQISASEGATTENIDDASRTEGNIIEANQFIDVGVGNSCTLDPDLPCASNTTCSNAAKGICLIKANAGVALNIRSTENVIRLNAFSGTMGRGISNGGASLTSIAGWTPGTCTGDATRICSSDADCNLEGYDASAKGTCAGAGALTIDSGATLRNVSERNVLIGTYDTAALFAQNSDGFVFRGNVIDGGDDIFAGIRLAASVANGTVERNLVLGTKNAMHLMGGQVFNHTVRLNDFTGHGAAIRTTSNFTVAADLGGNYWGVACPGLDASSVKFDDDSLNPNVTDVPSYGERVASRAELPDPCP